MGMIIIQVIFSSQEDRQLCRQLISLFQIKFTLSANGNTPGNSHELSGESLEAISKRPLWKHMVTSSTSSPGQSALALSDGMFFMHQCNFQAPSHLFFSPRCLKVA